MICVPCMLIAISAQQKQLQQQQQWQWQRQRQQQVLLLKQPNSFSSCHEIYFPMKNHKHSQCHPISTKKHTRYM